LAIFFFDGVDVGAPGAGLFDQDVLAARVEVVFVVVGFQDDFSSGEEDHNLAINFVDELFFADLHGLFECIELGVT